MKAFIIFLGISSGLFAQARPLPGPDKLKTWLPCTTKVERLPGFPVILPNTSGSIFGNFLISPNVADLDLDGSPEIVIGRADGVLHVLDHKGQPKPGFPLNLGGAPGFGIDGIPALSDMDHDGDLEIIVATDLGASSKLWIFNHDATLLATWPAAGVSLGSAINYTPVATDLRLDTRRDVIIGSADAGPGPELFAIHIAGGNTPGFPFPVPAAFSLTSSAGVADLMNDAWPEIAFVGTDFQIHLLDSTGVEQFPWPIPFNGFRCSPAIGDLNNDGKKEIVVGEDNALAGSKAQIFAYETDGSLLTGWPRTVNTNFSNMIGSPSVADLDGDKKLEVLITASESTFAEGGSLYVWHSDGTLMNGWPQPIYRPVGTDSNVAVGDIDRDGKLEIVTISHFDQNMVYVFRTNGALEAGFPVDLDQANNSFASPVLVDMDGDKSLEIVFTWFFNSFDANSSFAAVDVLKIIPCSIEVETPQAPWPQFKHNPEHTGEHP